MRNTRHDGAKVATAAAQDGPRKERDDEERGEEDGVEDDRAERDDRESEQAVDGRRLEGLHESATSRGGGGVP